MSQAATSPSTCKRAVSWLTAGTLIWQFLIYGPILYASELTAWRTATTEDTCAGYRSFVLEFPEGPLRKLAEDRLNECAEEDLNPPQPAEPIVTTPKQANLLTPPTGHYWLIAASRPTLEEASALATHYKTTFPQTQVFLSQNNWYAISVGALHSSNKDSTKEKWILEERIPTDSFFSNGKKFCSKVDW